MKFTLFSTVLFLFTGLVCCKNTNEQKVTRKRIEQANGYVYSMSSGSFENEIRDSSVILPNLAEFLPKNIENSDLEIHPTPFPDFVYDSLMFVKELIKDKYYRLKVPIEEKDYYVVGGSYNLKNDIRLTVNLSVHNDLNSLSSLSTHGDYNRDMLNNSIDHETFEGFKYLVHNELSLDILIGPFTLLSFEFYSPDKKYIPFEIEYVKNKLKFKDSYTKEILTRILKSNEIKKLTETSKAF